MTTDEIRRRAEGNVSLFSASDGGGGGAAGRWTFHASRERREENESIGDPNEVS